MPSADPSSHRLSDLSKCFVVDRNEPGFARLVRINQTWAQNCADGAICGNAPDERVQFASHDVTGVTDTAWPETKMTLLRLCLQVRRT